MKKLILIIFVFASLVAKSQDIQPSGANWKTGISTSFGYYVTDSTVWIYKGATYGWTKLASYRNLKFKIDSLASKGYTKIQVDNLLALKLNTADSLNKYITPTYLKNYYLKKSDTAAMLQSYAKNITVAGKLNKSDTAAMLLNYKNALGNRVKYGDTASMLNPYATKGLVNTKLNISDTSAMLGHYAKQAQLNLKLNISDTASMLNSYNNKINARLKIADTSSMLNHYAKIALVNTKVNIADTSSMLSTYNSRINARLKISDTTNMLNHYAKKTEVALKVNIADTANMLLHYLKLADIAGKKDKTDSTAGTGYTSRDRLATQLRLKPNWTDTTFLNKRDADINSRLRAVDIAGLKQKSDSVNGAGYFTNYKATTKADLVGGKVPLSQMNDALLGAVKYQDNYNATTDSPTLPTAATANKGWYYVVSVAGTQQGLTLKNGDWIISNGVAWGKVDNNNAVTSVNSKVGAVSLNTDDVSEGTTNKYDKTVALTNGTGITVTGTYPNFTITNSAPSSGGTVTSVSGTSPIVSSGGNTPAISLDSTTWVLSRGRADNKYQVKGSYEVTTNKATTLTTINDTRYPSLKLMSDQLDLHVNIADTSAMLGHYIKRTDTASMLNHYIERGDTASMLIPYAKDIDVALKANKATTLTINGTGYDLTANRSWTTVSSIATGYGITGGTITSTGTLVADSSVLLSKVRAGHDYQAKGSYQPLATVLTNTTASYTTTIDTRLANTSGTNTGDNATNTQYSGLISNATHTGDATGSTALTLATVNSNVGTYNNITINAKGLATAGSNVSYEPAFGKNTAFNKNFGTSTTQVWGYDSHPTTVSGYGITDIASSIGLSSYLPLSGGTMSNTTLVSNLNADLLDGQHGSYYSPVLSGAISSHYHTSLYHPNVYYTGSLNSLVFTNQISVTQFLASATDAFTVIDDANSVITISTFPNPNYYYQLGFNNGGDMYGQVTNNGTHMGWKKYWHSGNDGAGSGLDADLLDGQHGSYYQPAIAGLTTNYLPKWNGSGLVNSLVSDNGTIITTSGIVNITNTTASTSSTTGALVVGGGIGVGGNLYIGNGHLHIARSGYSDVSFQITNLNLTGEQALIYNGNAFGFNTASGNINMTGSGMLGIGYYTDPTSGNKLAVNGNAYVGGYLSIGGLTATGVSGTGDFTFNRAYSAAGSASYPSYSFASSTGTGMYLVSAGNIGFKGNATFSGSVTATSFVKAGGTSAQYLLADGSVTTSSGAVYKGQIDGSTGSGLADGTGTTGWYYACSTAGTHNYGSGNITLAIGDQLYYNGSIWLKIPGAGSYTLPVASNVTLGGVKQSTGVTIDGSGNISVSTAYAPTAGSSSITTLGTISSGVWNGTAISDSYISSASTWNAKESALTFSTGLSRTGNTITNSITQYTDSFARSAQNTANTTTTGLLTSTDWTTFNSKSNLTLGTSSTTAYRGDYGNAAYSGRIASFTTTGNSGAATFSSNTLNIPTYTLAGLGGISGNQTITLGGILSGSGTTSISASAASGYYMPTTADHNLWDGKISSYTETDPLSLHLTGGTLTGGLTGTSIVCSTLGMTTTSSSSYGVSIVGSTGGARKIMLVGQTSSSNGFTVDWNGSAMAYVFNNGNVTIDGSVTASGGGFNSLRSLKNIHKDWVGSATDELSKFKLRDFNYKTRPEVDSTLGFIIDEIPNSVAKYVLMGEKKDAINVYTLHGLEIKAIQELTEKNKELEARLEKLEKLNGIKKHHKFLFF